MNFGVAIPCDELTVFVKFKMVDGMLAEIKLIGVLVYDYFVKQVLRSIKRVNLYVVVNMMLTL